MFSKLTAGLIILMATTHCSHDEHVPQEIDDKIEKKGETSNGDIGINKDGQVIIQTETDAAAKLKIEQFKNQNLEDQLGQAHLKLKRCREDLADPRLGGDGSVTDLPEIDGLKSTSEAKEEFGLDEKGNLKFVKREFYLERLKREVKYQKSLSQMLKVVQKNSVKCERTMAKVRVQHGLPAKRYKGEGHFDANGKWIQTKKHEHSLDDAFERAAMERRGIKKP